MMKLHDNPASPYCRKVKALMYETGQVDDVEIVFAVGHPLAPERMPLAHNPLGKIPALERDNGPAIYDSRVICRYLDARAEAGMYPEIRLWDVLTLEATADGIMDAAILMVYEGRSRPENMRYQPWVDAQWNKATRALDTLGARWMGHMVGPVDMGQIAIGCALGYIDFRCGDRDWRQGRDALAAWYAEFAKRPSMKATVPVG